MAFGLRNTGNTFQRLVDTVCRDLPFTFTYLDDLLILRTPCFCWWYPPHHETCWSPLSVFPTLKDIKELMQRFLGLVNVYRKFTLGQPRLSVLSLMLWSCPPKFSHGLQRLIPLFQRPCKGVLISLQTLIHPDPAAPISLARDASDIHIGGALHQFEPWFLGTLIILLSKAHSNNADIQHIL